MAKPKLVDILKDLQEASGDPADRKLMFDDSNLKIRAGIDSRNEPNMRIAIGRMRNLSNWFGRIGASQVLKGESGGWGNLKLSALYQYWCIRFFVHVFLIDTRTAKATRADGLAACLCFNQLVATGSFDEAVWLGAAIKRSRSDKSMNWIKMSPRPFESFTARLFNAWQRLPIDDGLEPSSTGVYQGILDAWSADSARLVSPVTDACDYHIARTQDPSDEGYPEFLEFFYAAFPVEIIAIRRIREALGLAMPVVDHPLLSTPLAKPPAVIEGAHDGVLSDLLSAARSMWPKL
jgi:hypothetical protein